VLLRIEDHDRGRCRPEYERAIVEDLQWLGLVSGGTRRVLRQSDEDRAYGRAVIHLGRQSPVYACQCSRADIARRLRADGLEEWDELRYPGTCRELRLAPAEGLGIRVTIGEEAVSFEDLRLGPQRQTPAQQCGDILLRDATGNWTYQLCVTVDDMRQGVNLVVRGEDLLASTGRQIMLAHRLGRKEPALFLHHPLVSGGDGRKLSKRDGSTGIRVLRAAGKTPEAVLGEAAFRSGLITEPRPIRPCPRSPVSSINERAGSTEPALASAATNRRLGAGGHAAHVLRGGAFGTLYHVELHLLTLGQGLEPVAADGGMIHEAILRAIRRSDESKALRIVEPLDRSSRTHCHSPEYCFRDKPHGRGPPTTREFPVAVCDPAMKKGAQG